MSTVLVQHAGYNYAAITEMPAAAFARFARARRRAASSACAAPAISAWVLSLRLVALCRGALHHAYVPHASAPDSSCQAWHRHSVRGRARPTYAPGAGPARFCRASLPRRECHARLPQCHAEPPHRAAGGCFAPDVGVGRATGRVAAAGLAAARDHRGCGTRMSLDTAQDGLLCRTLSWVARAHARASAQAHPKVHVCRALALVLRCAATAHQ